MFLNFTRSAALVSIAAGLFGVTLAGAAHAESVRKQCSTKYQAAKAANTLNGQSWNQFYTQCAAQEKAGDTAPAAAKPAAAAPAAPVATAPAASAPPPAASAPPPAASKAAKTVAAPPAAPAPETEAVATGDIVFPKSISPQYANLSAGAARRKTCNDQYHANMPANANGGLVWTQKGGGYYHECNIRLKGEK